MRGVILSHNIEDDQLQKTEVPGLYRSGKGVLINKDNESLMAYKKRKYREQEIDKMKEDLSSLKDDIQEIKNLLRGLIK